MPARKTTKEIKNEVVKTDTTLSSFARDVETMERVKTKIESFDKALQVNLLLGILEEYRVRMSDAVSASSKNDSNTDLLCALNHFSTQITENPNGIFLNLTSCDQCLWNACVSTVNELERKANDLEKIDRERATAVEKIRQSCATND